MFNFILKNTLLKKCDKESQNRLAKLLAPKYRINFICGFLFAIIFFAPPILLIFSFSAEESNIVLSISRLLYICTLYVFTFLFKKQLVQFITILMPTELYCRIYTKRGKALTKKDFTLIEKENEMLYQHVTSNLCNGYCYSICFDILQILQEGNLKFVAVEDIAEGKPYTMHVLYEKNGWVFDTCNQHQYPTEKCLKLHNAIVYRDFTIDDIKGLTYEEFIEKNYADLKKWCEENNCSQFWLIED